MEKIQAWVDGNRNFSIGRALYLTYGNNQVVKNIMQKGRSPLAEKLLLFEMQKLIGDNAAVSLLSIVEKSTKNKEDPKTKKVKPDQPTAAAADPKVKEAIEIMADSDDHVLKAIKIEWHKPYKKMCYLISQLDQFGSSNEPTAIHKRKELAADILSLEQSCMQCWAKRDFYLEHGILPGEKSNLIEVPSDPLELATLINRVKKNIRNNRALMLSHPDKPGYAKKYLSYKEQYHQLTGKNYQEHE
jgi:hypothetical protein